MFSLSQTNSTASNLFSAYASFTAAMMLIKPIISDLIPHHLQSRFFSFLQHYLNFSSSQVTLTIDEFAGFTYNQLYQAAELYLTTKISPSTKRLKVTKTPRHKNLNIAIDMGQEIQDLFQNIKLKWIFRCIEPGNKYNNNNGLTEKYCFELSFNNKYKDKVLDSYLPFVLEKAKTMKEQEKIVKLYSRNCPSNDEDDGGSGHGWGSINLEHPATFQTLAMDLEAKKAIIEDLERFVRRKEFYKKVGKAWKRGYLLYGPPGTGKSSLIAAMANYLKFDVYDLELTSIYSNSELRRVLLSTTNRSILVIEDIDCSADVQHRQDNNDHYCQEPPSSKLTLSGILNFIDGLWSSCGDERIIVFTTNHKDRLDPALLRPGRMDMHIHMSYCTVQGFRLLLSNYLAISGDNHQHHHLLGEIEALIASIKVTPAEVAEELMKSDDADVALEGLVKFLHWKTTEGSQSKGEEADQVIESPEENFFTHANERNIFRNNTRRIGRGNRGRGRGYRGRGRLINMLKSIQNNGSQIGPLQW